MNKEIKTPEDLEDYCKKTTGHGMNVPPFVYIDKYFEDIEKAYGNGYRAGYKERFDCNIGEAEKGADNVRNSLMAIKATQKQSCEEEDVAKAFQLGLAFGLGERHDEMDKVIGEVKKSVTPQPCDDAISRHAVIEITAETGALETQARVKALPPVTPQQNVGHCKDCKYFEICSRWGDGCKSKEDGYCFLFEQKESEVEE